MKYALVTGGTRGIGLATVRLLSKRGYKVIALWSSDEASANSAAQELPAVQFIRADVADESVLKEVFEQIPSLDLLVCNAGIAHFGQVQDTTKEDFDRVLCVNLGGVVFSAKYAVKKMLSRGGAIVTVSSVWGETGASCESIYSASKGAVVAFTKALAKELAPSGITVNCVSPGIIDTEMNARFSLEERREMAEEVPLGRFGTVEEVAEAILFLAENRYITGQILGVNGGFYI